MHKSADYWDTQFFLFSQKFQDQSFFPNCEKTEPDAKFLKLCVDLAYSIDSKNDLIFENWQFNSWLMSNMLFNFRLSCTIFHGTFFNSDCFFRTLVVKILIFIRKKWSYLEFQLWVLLKIWLSPRKRRKKDLTWRGIEPGSTKWASGIHTPRPQRKLYYRMNLHEYISEMMK